MPPSPPENTPASPPNSQPPARDQITLPGVYLLTNDANGPVAIPDLALVVDQLGLTVLKPDGQVGAVLPWDQVRAFKAAERSSTPQGQPALVLEATDTLKAHRFVVPAQDPDALQLALGTLASRTGPRAATARERRLRPVLVGALVVLVAAAVAILLLASAGAIKL